MTSQLLQTQKLSKLLRKSYIHPVKREIKAMTIGIGFMCDGGAIIGADRQMTSPGSHKFSKRKIFYSVEDQRILAMVGGDDLDLAEELWWKLLEYPIEDFHTLEHGLMNVLDDMGRLSNELPLQLICGIATKTNTDLLGFRGKGVYSITSEPGIICVGDSSLIRYLSENIGLFWKSISDGVTAAAYLLKRAEEFVDMCHGPMDIVVLRPGPSISVIDPSVVEELDKRIMQNRNKAFKDLLSLSPPFSI